MTSKRICCGIAYLLIVIQCLLIMSSSVVAIENTGNIENEVSINSIELKPILSKNVISANEVADVTFECNMDVSYSEINADGVDVDIIDTDLLQFQLGVTDENGFGRFDLIALTSDGEEIQSTVYTYQHQNNMYLSEIAHEVAWYLSKESTLLLDSGEVDLIAKAACEEEYTTLFGSTLNYEVSKSDTHNESATKAMVEGHIDWETYQSEGVNNPTLPMRNARVELRKKEVIGSTLINSDMTDKNGDFTIYVNNEDLEDTQDVFIRICLEAYTFTVRMDWLIAHYYYDSGIQLNLTPGSYMNFDCTIPVNETLTYKATYVHQAMVIAERFAYAMGFRSSNRIRVAYPGYGKIEWEGVDGKIHTYDLEETGFCYGNFGEDCISAIGVKSYNRTKIMVHEYSHYIQCSLGNFGEGLPEVIFMSYHDGHSDYLGIKKDKSFAMHLAWAEGWGYAFSTMAQAYYFSEYQEMTDREYLIDTNISSSDEEEGYKGEFQELSVKAFLWNLVDQSLLNPPEEDSEEPVEPEELDYQLPWTPQEWWNMTTVPGTCRFPDFMRLIEEEGYDESMNIDYKSVREGIAEYLTKYNIAPQINSITYTSGILNISVRVNGSEVYPNNRLVIKIFDENNNLLAESGMIEVNRGRFENFNLSIPDDLWSEVLSNYSCANGHTATIKISVEGCRYDMIDPSGFYVEDEFKLTGPYYSEYCSTTLSLSHNYTFESVNENHHRQVCTDCGSVLNTASHHMEYVSVNDQYHKQVCSDCGYSTGNKLHTLKSSELGNRYKYCTACGHTVITGGNLIFPVGPDGIIEEEYTE